MACHPHTNFSPERFYLECIVLADAVYPQVASVLFGSQHDGYWKQLGDDLKQSFLVTKGEPPKVKMTPSIGHLLTIIITLLINHTQPMLQTCGRNLHNVLWYVFDEVKNMKIL